MPDPTATTRRAFLGGVATVALSACAYGRRTVRARPVVQGVQSGDPTASSALIWSCADREARLVVEWSRDERFATRERALGSVASPTTGFTARCALAGLPAGADIFYRAVFEDGTTRSAPAAGRLRTPPREARDLTLAWSGDVCGQGWGINLEWGGLRGFAALRRLAPDLFIHSGDQIYADNPIVPEVRLPDGRVWKNLVTPAKERPATTLDAFRGQYRYNFLDAHYSGFFGETAMVAQWDDHEVKNNWSPAKGADQRALAALARQAFLEHNAIAAPAIYRRLSYGPSIDLFVVDGRSFRDPTTFLGREQLTWLGDALAASRATWKIICCDVPLGLVIPDAPWGFEGIAQSDPGPPLGRELEIAELLARHAPDVLFITADVHYAAAHLYHPPGAAPFWEFVAGPLHAGTFGPNALDPTFGPELVFQRAPPKGQHNLAPWDGMQSFGSLRLDGKTQALAVALHDGEGAVLWQRTLEPSR